MVSKQDFSHHIQVIKRIKTSHFPPQMFTLPSFLCTYQVVEHSHESLKLLLPDLPLQLCGGPVARRLWDPRARLVFGWVQQHQIIWPSSAGQRSHLKEIWRNTKKII